MPTYSCHIPENETAIIDKAIADQSGGKEGAWLKEAVRQRLEREGYLPGTEAHARKEKLRVLGDTLSDADLDALVAKQFAAKATQL
jgi:hypothetical protein